MVRWIRLALLTTLICSVVSRANAQTRQGLHTPQLSADYAQGVSGHLAAMLQAPQGVGGEVLLMAGGCNFPEAPAAEGGAKRFYSQVYLNRGLEQGAPWELVGRLPEPTAYAAAQTYRNGVIVAGGQTNSGRELALVYRLELDEAGQLKCLQLPRLPEPRSGMGSALVGSRLYLVGGSASGRLSTTMISLDLEQPEAGWRTEPCYPGPALLKVATTSLTHRGEPIVVLLGAFAHSEGESGVCTALTCLMYRPASDANWTALPTPPDSLRQGATFGGGWIAPDVGTAFAVGAGVHEARFLPALERIQQLRRAQRLGDHELTARLQAEGRDYLLHRPEWYRFASMTLRYDFDLGQWQRLEGRTHPESARADAAYAGGYTIGGEIKPGVRTSSIVRR